MILNIKKSIFTFFAVTFLVVLPACWATKESSQNQTGLTIINVVEPQYFNDCHIAGSINVPFTQMESYAKKLDKNSEVVLYCTNYRCTASGESVKLFKNLGFNKVWAYEGGIAQWYQLNKQDPKKFPIVGKCAEKYLTLANEKPKDSGHESIPTITAQELQSKMVKFGLIKN
jgi:rhodanese-related sulfurtransferase